MVTGTATYTAREQRAKRVDGWGAIAQELGLSTLGQARLPPFALHKGPDMLLISKVCEAVEFDRDGDPIEVNGSFEFKDEPFGFRELVRMIRDEGFCFPSCSPSSGATWEWVSTEPETDYAWGEVCIYSLHYSHTNPDRNAKYWKKAFRAAGIK